MSSTSTPLTGHQIVLVQSSFTLLIDNIDLTARVFFDELFMLDPSLLPMFTSEMQMMGRKMIKTLLVIVNALNDPSEVVGMLTELSKRHVTYGVKEEYYATVGEALRLTVQKTLGRESSAEIESAWVAAYDMVASIAKAAAYPKAAVSSAE